MSKMAGQTETTGECVEYLTTAIVGDDKVVLLDVHEANDVTVLRYRFRALLLFGPPVVVSRGEPPVVLLRFHGQPSGVILQGALGEGKQMDRRENGAGASVPIADDLAVPSGVVHTAIHSPRPEHPSGGLRYKDKRAPASLRPNGRAPSLIVGGAWLPCGPTGHMLGTDVTSFLSRFSVIGSYGLCLLNGACIRAEWVKQDDTVQYVQDRLGLLRRLLRPERLNAREGCGDDSSGSVLDGVGSPRGMPAVDSNHARILGNDRDAHGEVIRAFPEAITFWKAKERLQEHELSEESSFIFTARAKRMNGEDESLEQELSRHLARSLHQLREQSRRKLQIDTDALLFQHAEHSTRARQRQQQR